MLPYQHLMLPLGEILHTAFSLMNMASPERKENNDPNATAVDAARSLVETRYHDLAKERELCVDKIFYDGHGLQELDPSMSAEFHFNKLCLRFLVA